jgi:hypothetical protein
MVTLKTKPDESKVQHELWDETFMSATDLRNCMTEILLEGLHRGVSQEEREMRSADQCAAVNTGEQTPPKRRRMSRSSS